MKVNNETQLAELIGTLKQTGEIVKEKTQEQADIVTEPSDTVEISDKSRQTRLVRETLDNVSDVDEEKVDALKDAIKNGTYTVSGEEVADEIIEDSVVDIFL